MDSGADQPNIDDLPDRMAGLETRAFDCFAQEFGPRFRAYFLRRSLPVSEAEDLAESCVQDISLKVARRQFVSQGAGSFEKWIFTLLHHAFVDWLRKREPLDFRSMDQLNSPLFGSETNPDDAVCLAVDEALEQFHQTDRVILALRDMESEFSYEEIGQRLNMSPGAVRVRHHRILKRLKAILLRNPTICRLLEGKKDFDT